MKQEILQQLIFEWQDRVMTRQEAERHIEPRLLESLKWFNRHFNPQVSAFSACTVCY